MSLEQATDPQGLLRGFFALPAEAEFLRRLGRRTGKAGAIPKTIHQIWLGSPLPKRLARFRQSWMRHHPDWDFKLWNDDDLRAAEFSTIELIRSARCYGQKSDLLRAEVIHRYGGVYVDLDYECFNPLPQALNGDETFFAVLRWIPQAHLGWPDVFPSPLIACNSLFGAEPGCPLLLRYIERVRERFSRREQLAFQTDELDKITLRALGGEARAARLKETALLTYLPFHEAVWEAGSRNEYVRLFPPAYFNPVISGWPALYVMPQFWKTWRTTKAALPAFWKYSGTTPATVARHWSTASWL